jgi:hypothetical protein
MALPLRELEKRMEEAGALLAEVDAHNKAGSRPSVCAAGFPLRNTDDEGKCKECGGSPDTGCYRANSIERAFYHRALALIRALISTHPHTAGER